MKEKLFILSFVLLTLSFYACFNDEVETPSCVSIKKTVENEFVVSSKVWETKEIAFDLLNDCNYDYTILDFDASGDIKNIIIKGLTKNKVIKSKELNFKVIISPTSTGNKTIKFSIRTDIGQIYVSVGIDVEK